MANLDQVKTSLNKVQSGKAAEDVALEFYLNLGYKLVVKNYEYYSVGSSNSVKNGPSNSSNNINNSINNGRKGEIDLILENPNLRQKTIYLVEVRSRNSENSIMGFTNYPAITQTKLKTLYFTYKDFLRKNQAYQKHFCQFDLFLVTNQNTPTQKLERIPNAYSFEKFYR